jgi:RNA polymerase sigma-70 factor (ECF subfamily)
MEATEEFEQNRDHLRAVAQRMLGSPAEADDAVQEAWLRLSRSDTAEVENMRAWLTTVVSRICLDMLRARRTRREDLVDEWSGQPVVALFEDRAGDPEHEALLADSVGVALMVVLDTLAPAERLAFVLHDMFGVPFDEIGPIIDRNAGAARQLASRARRRVRGAHAPDAATLGQQRWTRSSPRRGRGTSRPSSRCSIPTSCSEPRRA